MEVSSKILVKRIVRDLISPYWGKLGLAVLFMVIVAGTSVGQVFILRDVIDKIFIDKNLELLKIIALAFFAIFFIRGIAGYAQQVFMGYVESFIIIDVQRMLFNKLLISDVSFFSGFSSGRIISHFTNDVNALKLSVSSVFTNIVRELLSLVFLLGAVFYLIPDLALVTLFVFPLAIFPVYHLGKKMRKISRETQVELGSFTTQIDEAAQGIRVIKAYNAEGFERGRIFALTENLKKLYKKTIRTNGLSSPLMETISGVAFAIVIYLGGLKVINGEITGGDFFAFIAAIMSAYKPMKSLTKLNNQLQQGLAAASRIFGFLDEKPHIIENKKAKKFEVKKGELEFKDVAFSYGADEGRVLQGIDFKVKKGETYALIGKSGSGKTTLMNLLLRFYDPLSGFVKIDGVDLQDMSFEDLRDNVAYVSQDIFLFDDTVRANICYGIKKGVSEKKLIEAAKQAEAYEFISELESGFDTKIGQRGSLLSGGQKQRLVLARAFLKDAPILLLDEATSALDSISEKKIQNAFEKLKKNRTCLVIAHRLNTIENADRIMILSKGKIIESGSHKELLRNSKYYQSLQKIDDK